MKIDHLYLLCGAHRDGLTKEDIERQELLPAASKIMKAAPPLHHLEYKYKPEYAEILPTIFLPDYVRGNERYFLRGGLPWVRMPWPLYLYMRDAHIHREGTTICFRGPRDTKMPVTVRPEASGLGQTPGGTDGRDALHTPSPTAPLARDGAASSVRTCPIRLIKAECDVRMACRRSYGHRSHRTTWTPTTELEDQLAMYCRGAVYQPSPLGGTRDGRDGLAGLEAGARRVFDILPCSRKSVRKNG
ncbi:hypothetical protein OH76DRAFT_1416026 [Lentinus brumalis]|uniref:Uncharacterized protein n=1 Tax=Lentinus brumalis TaxID=2498619 RepID=A0A371DLD1_9APHY|nr:hypothetical protein OH76DRAFT_1416026 [Polyporus brumalis]